MNEAVKSSAGARAPWLLGLLGLALCLVMAVVSVVSNFQEARYIFFAPATGGDLHAQFSRELRDGVRQVVVRHIAPESPLTAAGITDGETVRLDHHWDDLRLMQAGETIGLTHMVDGKPVHVRVKVPAVTPPPLADRIRSNINLVANLPMLVIGIFMLWRSRGNGGVLALSMAFMGNSTASPYRWPIAPDLYPYWHVVTNFGFGLVPWFFLYFCLDYYNSTTSRVRPWEKALFWSLTGLQFCLYAGDMAGVMQALSDQTAAVIGLGSIGVQIVGLLMAFAYLIAGWRLSGAEMRKRYVLLIIALAATFLLVLIFIVLTYFSNLFRYQPTTPILLFLWGSQIFGAVLFAYAIFRHRILDVGFAINRTLVYGLVTTILLVSFGLLEWALDHFVKIESREKNAFIDAALALGVFLTFHRVRDFVEAFIERLFFRSWHQKEAALKRFVAEAGFVTRTDALTTAFIAALTRFGEGAEAAFYLKGAEGDYALAGGALSGASATLDANNPVLVSLRAKPRAVELDGGDLPGALALPMLNRNEVTGVVLLGAKPSGAGYRPDEIEALSHAATQIGLDLHGLKVEHLEAQAAVQDRTIALLTARNDELRQGQPQGA